MTIFRYLLGSIVVLVMASCGGGGSGGKSTVSAPPAIDLAPGGDADGDGLSNLSEVSGFELVFDGVTRTVFPNPQLADSDGDGLNDGYELYFALGNAVSNLSTMPGDSDGNGIAGSQRDAVLAAVNGVLPKAYDGLVDQDGDRIPRDTGIPWYDASTSSWTYISTDPTSEDSDGDRIYDAAEIGIQLTFRHYRGFDQDSAKRVLVRLNPSSSVAASSAPPFGAGVAAYDNEASLERDSDGGGRPDIEEWWANTDPTQAHDDSPYNGCIDAGKPGTPGGCTETPQWSVMTGAHFRYIPGGFDANDDGDVEHGYWISQFEAKDAGLGDAADPNSAQGGASMAAFLSSNFKVYNADTTQFDQRLCKDGGHIDDTNGDGVDWPGSIPTGCRSSEYHTSEHHNLGWWNTVDEVYVATASGANISASKVTFIPEGTPLVRVTSIEATIALLDSPVEDVYPISLPSAIDWMQLVATIIPHEFNWSQPNGDGFAGLSDGEIIRGHTDDENSHGTRGSALAIGDLDTDDYRQGYDGTGDGNGIDYIADPDSSNDPGQRRTHIVANGMAARDFTLPLEHSVVIWDLGGNVWEWTADLVAARYEISSSGSRRGGDRFLHGDATWQEFNGAELVNGDLPMPAWWKPVLPHAESLILGSQQGAGSYYDGNTSEGALYNGGNSRGGDYASIRRGGHWSYKGEDGEPSNAGITTTILHSGVRDPRAGVGFRAVGSH
jgi:hypothetical protein